MSSREELADELAQRRRDRYAVTQDAKGKPKPPDLPGVDDLAGQAAWLTSVLNLDPANPIVRGEHQGLSGGAGHVELFRLASEALRFEPASNISNPRRLADELVWQLRPTDGEPHAWTNRDAVKIARVVRLLCGAEKARTTAEETGLIVTTFVDAADPVAGNTYGTSGEKAEAVAKLRPVENDYGNPVKSRYLVDSNTGEFVIRVRDLREVARRVIGGTVAHGALDAWMQAFGWQRRYLQGHATASGGRRGAHASCFVYRGHLSGSDDDGSVGA